MPKKTMREAINEAMRQEMERDPTIVVIGEDVAGGAGGTGARDFIGGVMGVTKGLHTAFGDRRVVDTPISEQALVGAAVGASLAGLRPVAELMFVDFAGICLDQLMNQAAKFRYMFGGKTRTPLVVRTMIGAGFRGAAHHSQTLYNIFTSIPGLKCVVPSSPYDAKGLLIEAIRDDDPVIFFEHKMLYGVSGEVPDELYTVPFGKAALVREGEDLSIIALAKMVHTAVQVAENLAKDGIEAEVLDLRTTSPLDREAVLACAERTGRVLVVDEAPPRCGMAADIAALIAEDGHDDLRAPVLKVTAPHTPVPFAPELEDAWIPSAATIEAQARRLMEWD